MKYFEHAKKLAKAIFSFEKYKAMPLWLAIICGILMVPYWLIFIVWLVALSALTIFLSFLETPINFLHNIMKDEAKEKRTPVEVVIYIISWPLIFVFYAFFAITTITTSIIYFFTEAWGFVASLGGFRFHIRPT
jgi:cobalamin synthase